MSDTAPEDAAIENIDDSTEVSRDTSRSSSCPLSRPHLRLVRSSSGGSPLDRFRSRISHLWDQLAPLCCADDDVDDLERLRCAIANWRDAIPAAAPRNPAADLEALLAGWLHFDAERRAVLRGTVRYLTRSERAADDLQVDELLVDLQVDELLVDAAVHVVMRRNG